MTRTNLARLLAVGLAIGASLCVAASARASAPTVYTVQDPNPDAGGAPDITSVTIANTATAVVMQVAIATAPLPTGTSVAMYIDTDQNPTTGDGGAELLLIYDSSDNAVGAFRWNGSSYAPASAPSLRGELGGGVQTFSISPGDLGANGGFNFVAVAAIGPDPADASTLDVAPDTGVWNYQLQTQVMQVKLTIAAGLAQQSAKAGSIWTAGVVVRRSDTGGELGAEGSVTCRATVGGVSLTGIGAGVSRGGDHAFLCAWRIPRTAGGKVVTGAVTVSYQGSHVRRTFVAHIR